jgi:hypothetical protein
MPLSRSEDFGTDVTGFRVNDFCKYCFRDGAFTEPTITMAGMIDKCVSIMTLQHIMPDAEARKMLTTVMPNLKRWQTDQHQPATSATRHDVW